MTASDPFVVLLSVLLLSVFRALCKKAKRPDLALRAGRIAPILAVLLATGLHAAWIAAADQPITTTTIGHGIAAGGLAVTGHAQWRAFWKALAKETTP